MRRLVVALVIAALLPVPGAQAALRSPRLTIALRSRSVTAGGPLIIEIRAADRGASSGPETLTVTYQYCYTIRSLGVSRSTPATSRAASGPSSSGEPLGVRVHAVTVRRQTARPTLTDCTPSRPAGSVKYKVIGSAAGRPGQTAMTLVATVAAIVPAGRIALLVQAAYGRAGRTLRTVLSVRGADTPPAPSAATTAPTAALTATPSARRSAGAMPRGDLVDPRGQGWHQVFADDFSAAVPLGDWPGAVSRRWWAYPAGWHDTSGNGDYDCARVCSQRDGMLDLYLHTEGGRARVAAPVPLIPGALPSDVGELTSGRYAVRFRADPVPGYKTAWLLWPQSESWPRDGEIDFPEGELDGAIAAFLHRQGATSGSDQDAYTSPKTYGFWHTAVIEWLGGRRASFYLDGALIGETTARVPKTPMHWVLQTETSLDGSAPSASAAGHVQIDWVAVWLPASGSVSASPTPRPSTAPTASALVSAAVTPGPSATSDTVTLAAFGDFGTDNSHEAAVASLVSSWNPAALLGLGDDFYSAYTGVQGGLEGYDRTIGRYYCRFLRGVYAGRYCGGGTASAMRLLTSAGNHDYSDGGLGNYLGYLRYPNNGRYFRRRVGNVDVFVVDSEGALGDGADMAVQKDWLASAARASNADWQVVLFHHPPFTSTSGGNPPEPAMDWPFRSWGVDLVVNGHNHNYERIARNGITYTVVGTGGADLYDFGDPVPGSLVRYNGGWGALRLTASASSLSGTFIDTDGAAHDRFSVAKVSPP